MNCEVAVVVSLLGAAFGVGCGGRTEGIGGGAGNPGNWGTGGSMGGTDNTGGFSTTGGTTTGGSANTGGFGNAGGQTGGLGGVGPTACTNIAIERLPAAGAANGFVTGVYGVGDGDASPSSPNNAASTLCLESPVNGELCLHGLAADACGGVTPCDYHRWGTMVGIALFGQDALGGPVAFDAKAAGVAGVRFTLTGAPPMGVRPQLTMVNYETSPFVLDGNAQLTTDVTMTAMFAEYLEPSWGIPGLLLDLTQLDSVQFQIPSVAGTAVPYAFCVSNVKFVDANGTEVTPPSGTGAP